MNNREEKSEDWHNTIDEYDTVDKQWTEERNIIKKEKNKFNNNGSSNRGESKKNWKSIQPETLIFGEQKPHNRT